jgi:hypothetical protein
MELGRVPLFFLDPFNRLNSFNLFNDPRPNLLPAKMRR